MKIRLLVSRVSTDGANAHGDIIDVSDEEAYKLITSTPPQAEPKVKKDLVELEKRIEAKRVENAQKQAKIIAVQKEQDLKKEADALLKDMLSIVRTIESIDPEYKALFIEKFHTSFVEDKK